MNEKVEERAVEIVAHLMTLSARTAPKARGMDNLVIRVVKQEDLSLLAHEMRRIGEAQERGFFLRDAGTLQVSDACVLIGLKKEPTAGLDCGACGFPTCQEMLCYEHIGIEQMEMKGPCCAIRVIDLGIAVGSAVKTAALHSVDNRVQFSVGLAALRLEWMKGCVICIGIPLKASGKNIYFDRS
ncbi:MAG: DUF2148 domain-containing protein [Methanomicrobiales archaeon]|nr:DUF2148 domain-containing protein [Methanomicrobiales archaeon]